MPKQYLKTKEVGNQISLVSSKSAGNKVPGKTLVETEKRATLNIEETDRVFSLLVATYRSKEKPSIVKSRPSRGQELDETELKSLRAKKEREQLLRERQNQ